METLFRMMLLRPAKEISSDTPTIALEQKSVFQDQLINAAGAATPLAARRAAAAQYAAGAEFIASISKLSLAGLSTFASRLDQLETRQQLNRGDYDSAVKDAFGAVAAEVVNRDAFKNDTSRLRDSILAVKLSSNLHGSPIEQLTNALRDLEIVRLIAADPAWAATPAKLRAMRKASLILPASVAAWTDMPRMIDRAVDPNTARDKAQAALLDQYRQYSIAYKELTATPSHRLATTAPAGDSGSNAAKMTYPASALKLVSEVGSRMLAVGATEVVESAVGGATVSTVGRPGNASLTVESGLVAMLRDSRGIDVLLPGSTPLRPGTSTGFKFRLSDEGLSALSPQTRQTLTSLKIDLNTTTLDVAVRIVQQAMTEAGSQLMQYRTAAVRKEVRQIGSQFVVTQTPMIGAWNDVVLGLVPGFVKPIDPTPDPRVPHSHGTVRPVGVGDLLVIRQQLKGYEAVDISTIENALKGEKRLRTYDTKQTTEQTFTSLTETTTETSKDLESTDRFEMSRESQNTIKEDASLKAGLTVSGQYGPVVSFSASAEGSMSRSSEESTKTAEKYSRDVTQRASTKVTEHVLEQQVTQTTLESAEHNEHGIDNTAGQSNVAGIYQWVQKVYEAQVFNYGLRAMFDFMVPEPAAWLVESIRRANATATTLTQPIEFTLSPDQVTETNYAFWANAYHVTGIDPPPEPFLTVSADFNAGSNDRNTNYVKSGQISIPDGYQAVHASVSTVATMWDSNYNVDVSLGSRTNRFRNDGNWTWATSLDNETAVLPWSAVTLNVAYLAVTVDAKCQRTQRALSKWALDTHGKLTEAYLTRVSEYEEKLARLKAEAGVQVTGKNPASNLMTIADELKKACITVMTEQHFEIFDSVETGSDGLPQIDIYMNSAQGPYVRFFEQAFEWEQMTYLFYPYFWSRKSQWPDKVVFDDPDPMFVQFVKAGSCRVTVPIRPSFEGAVDHFMTTGEVWSGGPLPTISSPLYLPIATELAEELGEPGNEVAQGNPWEVRVPTSLILLRTAQTLPTWSKDANGHWTPNP